MTPDEERARIAAIADGLSESMRELLASVYSGFGVGDQFRPDEGERHAVYLALHRLGLFGRFRFGDMPTSYWLTNDGEAVRAYLKEPTS